MLSRMTDARDTPLYYKTRERLMFIAHIKKTHGPFEITKFARDRYLKKLKAISYFLRYSSFAARTRHGAVALRSAEVIFPHPPYVNIEFLRLKLFNITLFLLLCSHNGNPGILKF